MTARPAGAPGLRRAIAVGLLLATVGAAFLAPRIVVDNSLERWVGFDRELASGYARFRAAFGSDEFLLVAVDGKPLFAEPALAAMLDALERLERVPGVRRVQGLPAVFRDRFGGEDPEALHEEMTSTPFYRGLFISPDGAMAGILVQVEPAGPAGRRAVVDGVRRAAAPLEAYGFRVQLVGSTALIDVLDRLSERESARTFPVALLCSLLVLAWALRSWRAMAVAGACSAVSVLLTVGLAVACGRSLNMVNAALPALLWVLTLGNCVHLVERYRLHRRELEASAAMARALRETTRPTVLAALTTALGFLSVVVSNLVPVQEKGVLAAVGILIALAVTLTLGPTLILWLRLPAGTGPLAIRPRPAPGDQLPLRRPRAIVAISWVLLLLTMASLPLIHVESNPLSFLPADHPTARAYAEVGRRLTGYYTMEVVVDTPVPWWDPAVTRQLETLQAEIAASPVVARVISPLDVLCKLRQWQHGLDPGEYRLPGSSGEAATLLAMLDDKGREQLASLATVSGRTVRLSAVVREMDEHRFLGLVGNTRAALARLPQGWSGLVTGQVLQLVTAEQRLVVTQLESLLLAFVLVFATIGVGLRSHRLMLVSILPTVLPLGAAFLVMAAARIPLDAATVMVASVALGIAVDNTVHQLEVFRGHRLAGLGLREAVAAARAEVVPAMVTSRLTACAGFFALVLSAFLPVRSFGLLSGVAILVALAADVLLVPAQLVTMTRGRREQGASRAG